MKLGVATADLCLMSLFCFCSTYNGIERSLSSHHTINLVLLFGIDILVVVVWAHSDPKTSIPCAYIITTKTMKGACINWGQVGACRNNGCNLTLTRETTREQRSCNPNT